MSERMVDEFVGDSTIGYAIGPGDQGYRVELPAWFAQRVERKRVWDEKHRRWKVTTWRPVWEPLSANYRGHWRPKHDAIATVRGFVAMEAGPRKLALPAGEHLTVRVHYRPARPGSRDGMNLAPLSKAVVDGLARGPQKTRAQKIGTGLKARTVQVPVVGLDLVPDDTDEFVTELRPAILAPDPDHPALWVDVVVHQPLTSADGA